MTSKNQPWPKTEEELLAVIRAAFTPEAKGENGPTSQGYNDAGQALADCAVAAFNYACHVVGATGFQAGWASLQAYGEINGIDGPFGVVRASNMLYPQYDSPSAKAREWEESDDWKNWVREKAQEKLAELRAEPENERIVAGPVYVHWKKLAGESL